MWVDLARVDDRWSMLVRSVENQDGPPPFEIDPTSRHGDSYEFAIERQARRHIVRVAGHVVPVTLLVLAEGARAPVRRRKRWDRSRLFRRCPAGL